MAWLLMLIASLAQTRPAAPATAPSTAIRFHHLHYVATDVTAVLRALRPHADETPVILQGLGAGARFGRAFVLIDRRDPRDEFESWTEGGLAKPYEVITQWLGSHGLPVEPTTINPASLAALITDPGRALLHVAFATSHLEDSIRTLERAGAGLRTRTDTSALFTIRSQGIAGVVELVRDPELPDRFHCPMHPDVRSAVEGSCPICKMTLVPIPAPRVGAYGVQITTTVAPGGVLSGLTLEVREPDSSKRVTAFTSLHDRRMHLFLVRRDLESFAHVHPDQAADGTFALTYPIAGGEYLVVADFLPLGGTPQTVQRMIVTPGLDPFYLRRPVPAPKAAHTADSEGIRATLEAPALAPGREAVLRFHLTDAATSAPVADLEPYLSAPAHALTVSTDLTFAEHGHPASDAFDRGLLEVELTPPAAGAYKIWLQVQRRGQVITLPFVIVVPAL